jgi:trehalose 6-phosphate phosphatase
VGDDLTDEDGFAAAAALGGGGILVGPPRSSAARWRLADAPAVIRWLESGASEHV